MKSCPTCNRTFDESFTFCLVDGAVLSAPYDPQETQRIPAPRITNPPPTELLASSAEPKNANLPPTIASPLLQPTQPYIPLEFTPPSKQPIERVARNQEPVGRIVGGLCAGAILGIIIGVYVGEPKAAIPLALFFGLLGAIIGKVSSLFTKK